MTGWVKVRKVTAEPPGGLLWMWILYAETLSAPCTSDPTCFRVTVSQVPLEARSSYTPLVEQLWPNISPEL